MPIAEVNEDVKILKELVGKKDGKTLPEVEDAENDNNLYGYTEQNTLDIQELQSMVGSWTAETNVKPTSVATIS